ncbi:unnamed protein product, partial [Pleuronectes platessa]
MPLCRTVPGAQEQRNNSAVRCDTVRIMSTSETPGIGRWNSAVATVSNKMMERRGAPHTLSVLHIEHRQTSSRFRCQGGSGKRIHRYSFYTELNPGEDFFSPGQIHTVFVLWSRGHCVMPHSSSPSLTFVFELGPRYAERKSKSNCGIKTPNLKGRPRKKKLSISQRRDSLGQAQGQGSSGSSQGSAAVAAQDPCSPESKTTTKVKPNCKTVPNGKLTPAARYKANGLSKRSSAEEKERGKEKEREKEERSEREENKEEETSEENRAEEQTFLVSLYKYMKDRDTPIERIPFLGFKQINLWTMFQAAQKLGGYELITVRRQWKHVYDELGGNPSSTSAATCTRRHYE